MTFKFNESDITSEKSLWDIYKLSRQIKPSIFQSVAVIFVMVLLAINSFLLENNTQVILDDTRKWAETGFNFSITTLGFLIAGFTIFATLSKPKMMLAMMEHVNKKTGLPTLKYNFFTFMKVFIMYTSFSVLYLFIEIFGQENGLLSNVIVFIPNAECIKVVLINLSYSIVGSSFFYLLLLLKTFIFNIYAITMNFLRWEYNEINNENQD